MTSSAEQTWLDVAASAVEDAARVLHESGSGGRTTTTEAGREVKVEADRMTEAAIVAILQERTPFPVLSEEGGATGSPHPEGLRWVVDPVDGSYNYARGLPLFCVSIALWRGDEPVVGVVHDPVHGETFTGIVGTGAWLNGEKMRTSSVSDPGRAVLCTGFPVGLRLTDSAVAGVVEQVRRFMKVRLLGSAALSLAYVAAGRADGYAEQAIRVWDVAAGLALVLAAGGHVEIAPHGRTGTLDVSATNGSLRF